MSGRDSVELIESMLADSRTVVWNGPLGAFEIPPFDAGTTGVAQPGGGADRGRPG